MRIVLAVIFACALIAPFGGSADAQGTAKEKSTPKGKMVLLCPQQSAGGGKVNVDCAQGEKCCYQPLFDTGACIPQAQGCLGVVNPLPLVQR